MCEVGISKGAGTGLQGYTYHVRVNLQASDTIALLEIWDHRIGSCWCSRLEEVSNTVAISEIWDDNIGNLFKRRWPMVRGHLGPVLVDTRSPKLERGIFVNSAK